MLLKLISLIFSFFVFSASYAANVPISVFPLQNYNQTISNWINPSAKNYNTPLVPMPYQQARLTLFKQHFYGSKSPWNKTYVTAILNQQNPSLQESEQSVASYFDNEGKKPSDVFYGENFRPHTEAWINNIKSNMAINQFAKNIIFKTNQRGIMLQNTAGRIIPTNDLLLNLFTLPGQGFPFDNNQISAIWAGTPVYIIGKAKDKSWDLVLTPAFIAWVKANTVGRVNKDFTHRWIEAANKNVTAITKTKTSIINQHQQYLFSAYVGSVFPLSHTDDNFNYLLAPQATLNGDTRIAVAKVSKNNAGVMPIAATPHRFAEVISTLLNRPYGWGGMYFDNDCSQELRSLYAPFGIWLPRHSSAQVNAGKLVDESSANMNQRIQYLMQNGHPFMTIVYIGGHVIMYIGNAKNPNDPDHALMAMTYQNLWGLAPADHSRRSVIGESVLFPLLDVYPEDPSLSSLANHTYFQVAYLDQIPSLLTQERMPTLKKLIFP